MMSDLAGWSVKKEEVGLAGGLSVGGRETIKTDRRYRVSMEKTKFARDFRPEDYITIQEAARLLGCCRVTIYNLVAAGELEDFQLRDRGWRKVLRRSVLDLIARRLARSKRRSRR